MKLSTIIYRLAYIFLFSQKGPIVIFKKDKLLMGICPVFTSVQ